MLLREARVAGVAGLGMWAAYRNAPEVVPAPLRPAPRMWPDRGLFAAWLGHSSVLLKIDGTLVLTDPVFSRRIG
ncbi:MAG TPA: hypothetical protein VME43_21315, partial [Bryobacteraceae bacterium]|nr:hypothetical protein [Bryobacteraceae bacterium]